MFERQSEGWVERQRLTASDAADRNFFGSSVALTADAGTLGIGAFGRNTGALQSGAAYVFVRNGDVWEENVIFSHSDPGERDYFGNALAVTPSGSLALFGVRTANTFGHSSGAAYIYDLPALVPVEESATPLPAVRLAVYPNPTLGRATLSILLPEPGPVEVVLLNVLGRTVQSVWNGPSNTDQVFPIDASALPSGVYFLSVTTSHGRSVERFVLQR